jgi:RNA polymerase sigma-70 factor (ECF subfamily)
MELTLTSQSMAVLQDRAATRADDFEAIVRQYRPKIFRFALASLRDADVAETIAQDCFLKAFKAQDRFRHDCSMDTWLMQIAVNLVRDQIRNRRFQFWRRARLSAKPVERLSDWLSNGEKSAEVKTLLKEKVSAVWDAAESLPERQRTVFLLRFVEDMELLEIAAVTGMKEGTVKTHLFRALQAVRERMGASL